MQGARPHVYYGAVRPSSSRKTRLEWNTDGSPFHGSSEAGKYLTKFLAPTNNLASDDLRRFPNIPRWPKATSGPVLNAGTPSVTVIPDRVDEALAEAAVMRSELKLSASLLNLAMSNGGALEEEDHSLLRAHAARLGEQATDLERHQRHLESLRARSRPRSAAVNTLSPAQGMAKSRPGTAAPVRSASMPQFDGGADEEQRAKRIAGSSLSHELAAHRSTNRNTAARPRSASNLLFGSARLTRGCIHREMADGRGLAGEPCLKATVRSRRWTELGDLGSPQMTPRPTSAQYAMHQNHLKWEQGRQMDRQMERQDGQLGRRISPGRRRPASSSSALTSTNGEGGLLGSPPQPVDTIRTPTEGSEPATSVTNPTETSTGEMGSAPLASSATVPLPSWRSPTREGGPGEACRVVHAWQRPFRGGPTSANASLKKRERMQEARARAIKAQVLSSLKWEPLPSIAPTDQSPLTAYFQERSSTSYRVPFETN